MDAEASGSSKVDPVENNKPQPPATDPESVVICDGRLKRNFIVLIICSLLSSLICCPIGIIAVWNSLKIRKYALKGEAQKAIMSVAEVKFLLFHALGWGLLLCVVLTVVALVQYLYLVKT